MTKGKKLIALLGVLLTLCLAVFFISRSEERKERIKNSGETILAIPTADVTALAWENSSGSFSFRLEGDTWIYDGDNSFPVDTDKLEKLVEPLENLTADFVIETPEALSQYGLDDPVCTISVTAGEQVYTIELGDYSQMDSQRYLTVGDENVYLANHDPLDEFDAVLRNLVKNDTIPDFDDVTAITFSGIENYTIDFDENGESLCEDDVYFVNGAPLDTDRVKSYLSTIEALTLSSYVTYNATEEELNAYGLTEPELSVEIHYTEDDTEQVFTLHVGRNQEELAKASEGDSVTSYVRVGDSQLVYTISSNYNYTALTEVNFDDLRHQELFTADFGSLSSLTVTLENTDYAFIFGENEEGDSVWSYLDEEVDLEDIRASLALVEADTFTDTAEISDREEISLTFTLQDGRASTLAFYRLDGNHCLAVSDGTPVAYVSRGAVVDLIEAVNEVILDF